MKMIRETEAYSAWFAKLRDRRAKARTLAQLRRVELGNFGDCEPVGEGISELRIHYGPGYRVYFVQRGDELVILLVSGDKSSQVKEIAVAKQLARDTGLTREGLYNALSADGNPSFATVMKVTKALGFSLHVEAS